MSLFLVADDDDAQLKNNPSADAKLIQGSWTVVESHQGNPESSAADQAAFETGFSRITITADKLIHSPDQGEGWLS